MSRASEPWHHHTTIYFRNASLDALLLPLHHHIYHSKGYIYSFLLLRLLTYLQENMVTRPNDVTYANRGLSRPLRFRIARFSLLGWHPHAIAEHCRIGLSTAYKKVRNLSKHGSPRAPTRRKLGRPRRLTEADEDVLFEHLLRHGWLRQEEMRFWLWCERGVLVSQPTMSRIISRRKWSRKEMRWLSLNRSEGLRKAWREEMRRYIAEDLVFLDESIFNEKTGWRYQAYGPIGEDIRYPANTDRGKTWSTCAAITVNGWLPCTGVKEGYFKTHNLLTWLKTGLLPALRRESLRPRVVVLDNCSTHLELPDEFHSSSGMLLSGLFDVFDETFRFEKAGDCESKASLDAAFGADGDTPLCDFECREPLLFA